MKKKTLITIFLSLFPLGLISCGDDSSKKKNNESDLKSIRYNGAYAECNQILEHGIYENFSFDKAGKYLDEVAAKFCSYSEYKAEDTYRDMVSKLKISGRDGSADLDFIDIFSFGGGGGSSKAENFTSEEFRNAFRGWKQQTCSQFNRYTDSEFVYNVYKKMLNNTAIDSWRQCVLKKQYGIFCRATEGNETISITVEYQKPYFEAPNKMNLAWSTLYNVETISSTLPEYVGPSVGGGQGVRASFKIQSTDKDALIDINAVNDALTLSCGILIPKRRPPYQIPRVSWHDQKCEQARMLALMKNRISEGQYRTFSVKNWGPVYRVDNRPNSGIIAWSACTKNLAEGL